MTSMDESPAAINAVAARVGRVVHGARLEQGWSLGDLARATRLSKSILARIAAGAGNPSLETLWRVSSAFALPLGALLEPAAGPLARTLPARAGERVEADSGMTAWLVHAEGVGHRSELFELALPAGTRHATGPHLPGTTEVIVCHAGTLLVGPLGDEQRLGPGDAAWFAADVPHRYVAEGAVRATCLMRYPVRPT
jgi:XRE family transcriptional regulator, regulator of sulfur utilization